MNSTGSYVKYIPISIKFFRHKKNVYKTYGDNSKCQIMEKKNRLNYKIYAPRCDYHVCDLRDYLYQTFWYLDYINKDWYLKSINKEDMEQ